MLKNKWCQENNVPLIRIPYTRLKELSLKDLLLETTNFLVNYADDKSGKIGETLHSS